MASKELEEHARKLYEYDPMAVNLAETKRRPVYEYRPGNCGWGGD